MPGGSMSPFWGPVSATSTPQASKRKSIEASEDTVSTRSRAGWPARSSAARTAATSDVTPVDVSLWTTRTARTSRATSAREARLHLGGGHARSVGDLDALHVHAEGGGGPGEAGREEAVDAGQHPISRGERVDDRRFPGAGPRAGIERDVPRGRLKDLLEPVQALPHQRLEARPAMVEDRLGHGAHDALGHQRGSGNLQEWPTPACGESSMVE